MKYDIFIPSAPKDQKNLKLVIKQVYQNLDFNRIYVCSPNRIKNKITDSKIKYILDDDVFSYNKRKISFRPNWTYQQVLKMFFDECESDYFLSLDCDSFILKSMDWFEEGKPIWRYGWDQNHEPYFKFNKRFFNLDKTLPHTGIGDMGFFDKRLCKKFLEFCGASSKSEFLDLFCDKIDASCQFSEFEAYANYVNEYHKGSYIFKQVKQANEGRRLDSGQFWKDGEIERLITNLKGSDIEVLQAHSWKI